MDLSIHKFSVVHYNDDDGVVFADVVDDDLYTLLKDCTIIFIMIIVTKTGLGITTTK